MSWTAKMDKILRAGAARKDFARDIAASVNASGLGPVTRCAVIGRAHRLKVPLLPQPEAIERVNAARFDPDYVPKRRTA